MLSKLFNCCSSTNVNIASTNALLLEKATTPSPYPTRIVYVCQVGLVGISSALLADFASDDWDMSNDTRKGLATFGLLLPMVSVLVTRCADKLFSPVATQQTVDEETGSGSYHSNNNTGSSAGLSNNAGGGGGVDIVHLTEASLLPAETGNTPKALQTGLITVLKDLGSIAALLNKVIGYNAPHDDRSALLGNVTQFSQDVAALQAALSGEGLNETHGPVFARITQTLTHLSTRLMQVFDDLSRSFLDDLHIHGDGDVDDHPANVSGVTDTTTHTSVSFGAATLTLPQDASLDDILRLQQEVAAFLEQAKKTALEQQQSQQK